MLISKLDLVKQYFVYQRLFFISKYGCIKPGIRAQFLTTRLMTVVSAETTVSLLQAQLSTLCSHCCSYLTLYDDQDTNHFDWQSEIAQLIREIEFSQVLKDIIDAPPSSNQIDPLFKFANKRDKERYGRIMGHLLAYSNQKELSSIEHYTGSRISEQFPSISSDELQRHITIIKETDVQSVKSLQSLIDNIGREHAWDWRRAIGTKFLRGRLQ